MSRILRNGEHWTEVYWIDAGALEEAMGEKAYSDLYQIVRIVEEKKGRADLQEIGLLLNSQMRLRIVPKGERIFYMEDGKSLVYFVIRGSYINYRISRNGKMNNLGRSTAPVWSGVDRAVNASNINFTENKTLEECIVLEIKTAYFLEAVENNGRFGLYMIKNTIDKMTDISEKSDRLLFYDANELFAYFIIKFWEDHHDAAGDCTIEMKNADLAEEAGISARSLYRILNAWRKEDLISVKKGNIAVSSGQINRLKERFDF